jgi:hypothetical protein
VLREDLAFQKLGQIAKEIIDVGQVAVLGHHFQCLPVGGKVHSRKTPTFRSVPTSPVSERSIVAWHFAPGFQFDLDLI